MLPTHTTRIEITPEARTKFIAEKERTGQGAAAILRYAQTMSMLPKDTRLNSGLIANWFSGQSASAYEAEINAILAAYGSITFVHEFSFEPKDEQLVLIDDKLQHGIEGFLMRRRNSSRRLILERHAAPKGLTENRLKRLAGGRDSVILVSHLRFIRDNFPK